MVYDVNARVCVCMLVRACVCVRACACVRACVPACLPASASVFFFLLCVQVRWRVCIFVCVCTTCERVYEFLFVKILADSVFNITVFSPLTCWIHTPIISQDSIPLLAAETST